MSEHPDQHDRLIEAAMGAALKALEGATDDAESAEKLMLPGLPLLVHRTTTRIRCSGRRG